MTIINADVKLVYGGAPPPNIIATPPGSGLLPVASGSLVLVGTNPPAPPPVGSDLFLDFNDGSSNAALGINMAGSQTAYGPLPWRKHSYVASGGFDGGGFIRMTWFTGMGIGFSPVWVEAPGGFQPHYKMSYYVRQSATMIHPGSCVKLFRHPSNGYQMGTLEWCNWTGGIQRFRWFFDAFAIFPPSPNPNFSTNPCGFDLPAPGESCSPKADDLADGAWHLHEIEMDFRNPAASTFSLGIDGVLIRPPVTYPPATFAFPSVGSRFDFSPFAEMYSCGNSGCESGINSGTYDVDHFSYTIL